MQITRTLKGVVALAAVGLLATACGSLSSSSSSSSAGGASSALASSAASSGAASSGGGGATGVIKVGYVTPITGPLAAFGEGDQWVVDQMQAYFKEHPIQAGGTSYAVEVTLKDSQSDPKQAATAAADLINNDGVDIVMAHATPETTVPVSQACEANATPCITSDTPWQPWYFGGMKGDGKTPLQWAYHFFWGLEDITGVWLDMWGQVDSNKKVGGIFQNDNDGVAFTDKEKGVGPVVSKEGYTLNVPGLTALNTQDYTAQITAFKKNDDQLLAGIMTPPDFATFLGQAKQQGYNPKLITIGKAIEFPAAADAMGESAINLATEVWWTPTYPTKSSVTGLSSQEFADAYTKATGKQWNVTLGFSESMFEVMAGAVAAAGSNDKEAIAKALATLKVDSLVGSLDWGKGPVPNVAKTPLTGGQWRKGTGTFPLDLVIVSNSVAKGMGLDVPTAGKVEPYNK